MKEVTNKGLNRRGFFAAAGAGALAVTVVGLKPGEAFADAATTRKAVAMVTGGKEVKAGRIKIDAPQIAENGRVVPLALIVDSPMTESDYVKTVHIFVQNNPTPEVATFKFTPNCGKAHVSFRCRMGKTSPVIAVAEMSDGSVYQKDVLVKVTIGGCGG